MSATGTAPNTINVAANTTSNVVISTTNVFGDAVANATVYVRVGAAGSPPTATLTTNASGVAQYTVGGLSTSTQNVYVSDALTGGNVTAVGAKGASTLSYAPAADITPGAVTVTAPATATTISTTQGTANVAASGASTLVTFNVKNSATTPANLANAYVTATVSGGTLFATNPAGAAALSAGSSSISGQTDSSGNFPVYVASGLIGPVVVTLTADTKSASTSNITASNAGAVAAGAIIVPTAGGVVPVAVASGSVTSMTAIVGDSNGNPLGLEEVEVSISGDATFAGTGGKAIIGTTATNGRFAFDVKAGASGSFTVTVTSTETASATFTTPAIAVEDETALVIAAYRTGGNVVVDGDAIGFARGDSVTLETRKWNSKKQKWNAWKEQGTVLVKKDESFGGVISISGKVRVRAQADGVKSNSVVVAK